jgi:hypothetical protein
MFQVGLLCQITIKMAEVKVQFKTGILPKIQKWIAHNLQLTTKTTPKLKKQKSIHQDLNIIHS